MICRHGSSGRVAVSPMPDDARCPPGGNPSGGPSGARHRGHMGFGLSIGAGEERFGSCSSTHEADCTRLADAGSANVPDVDGAGSNASALQRGVRGCRWGPLVLPIGSITTVLAATCGTPKLMFGGMAKAFCGDGGVRVGGNGFQSPEEAEMREDMEMSSESSSSFDCRRPKHQEPNKQSRACLGMKWPTPINRRTCRTCHARAYCQSRSRWPPYFVLGPRREAARLLRE